MQKIFVGICVSTKNSGIKTEHYFITHIKFAEDENDAEAQVFKENTTYFPFSEGWQIASLKMYETNLQCPPGIPVWVR